MPYAQIRGVDLHYKIVGTTGPWFALTPGGRRSFVEFEALAEKIAAAGFRVLLHDRRNCGLSAMSFDESEAEDTIWADDLHALLTKFDALPAFIGGSSSGCRLSVLLYLRHRADVRGLLLFRVTGGAFAAKRLPEQYYAQFIAAARAGGMEAVCETDHWKDRIALRPQDKAALLAMSPEHFIAVMTAWHQRFLSGVDLPILGVSEAELHSIAVPTLVIPGNDKIHSGPVGRAAQKLIPGSTLHALPIEDTERDLIPYDEWAPVEDEIAETFVSFMKGAAKAS
jgi:pimeloyl-ACP methyl ester carboxylesterase